MCAEGSTPLHSRQCNYPSNAVIWRGGRRRQKSPGVPSLVPFPVGCGMIPHAPPAFSGATSAAHGGEDAALGNPHVATIHLRTSRGASIEPGRIPCNGATH